MRTKKDTERSLRAVTNYGPGSSTGGLHLVSLLHDLVDRLPDDEPVALPAPPVVDEGAADKGLAKEVVDAVKADLDAAGILAWTNGGQRILTTVLAIVRRHAAPPAVDEAEIRGLIVRVDEEGGWSNIFPEEAVALAAAIAAHLGGARR